MWGFLKHLRMQSLAESFAGGSTYCESAKRLSMNLLRIKTGFALLACVMLFGCIPRQHAIPNYKIPHRVAESCTVVIFVRRDDGQYVTETVDVPVGWWIASPHIVEQ